MNDAHDNAQADKEALEKAIFRLTALAKGRLQKALDVLTARRDEPWSPKIAAAVPEIREALKLLGAK